MNDKENGNKIMDKQKIYQIKSTPFVRRLVSKSKQNGELQRLKDEYERIKCLNDRIIQVRLRQMRLKRLYRVIEMIKNNPQNSPYPKQKSNEQQRAEQIHKARQLGQEFSRNNALHLESASSSRLNNRNRKSGPLSESRSRIIKRIQYGNQRSRINMEEMTVLQQPKPPLIYGEKEINKKRELLKQRIKYGNSCSLSNLRNSLRLSLQVKDRVSSICRLNWLDSVNTPEAAEQMLGQSEKDLCHESAFTERGNSKSTDLDSITKHSPSSGKAKLETVETLRGFMLEDFKNSDTELKRIRETANLHQIDNSLDMQHDPLTSSNEKIIKSQRYSRTISKNTDNISTRSSSCNLAPYLKTLDLSHKHYKESKQLDKDEHINAVQTIRRIFEHQWNKVF